MSCCVPPESPISPTLPNLVLMAGRRWPMEETIATGKGPLGWDHHQYRTWTSLCHHTALCGLAMLKATALRAYVENTTAFPSPPTAFSSPPTENTIQTPPTEDIPGPRTRLSPPAPDRSPGSRDEVMIPLGDSPVPGSSGSALSPEHWLHPAHTQRDTTSYRDSTRGTVESPNGIPPTLVEMAQTTPGDRPMAPLPGQTRRSGRADLNTDQPKGGDAM